MSFKTKTKMWWGSVVTKTEEFFEKPKKRFVAHEYFENPTPPSVRPKSMHTLGSIRRSTSQKSESMRSPRNSMADINPLDGYQQEQSIVMQPGPNMQDIPVQEPMQMNMGMPQDAAFPEKMDYPQDQGMQQPNFYPGNSGFQSNGFQNNGFQNNGFQNNGQQYYH